MDIHSFDLRLVCNVAFDCDWIIYTLSWADPMFQRIFNKVLLLHDIKWFPLKSKSSLCYWIKQPMEKNPEKKMRE